jgi:hypothetical protein
MLLTTIGLGGEGRVHSLHDNISSIFFPLPLQFQHPSLLNDIQVEILIFGQRMRMEINILKFIYIPIMDAIEM